MRHLNWYIFIYRQDNRFVREQQFIKEETAKV